MKKLIILILMIGFLMFCQEGEKGGINLYEGKLIEVKYTATGGLGGFEAWTLTFEDGQVYTIHSQLLAGYKIGDMYTIYQNRDGYLRARTGK